MIRSVLGGLLGGLALFITGFLFWGTPLSALAISRADEQASANLQAALAQALNATTAINPTAFIIGTLHARRRHR